VSGERSSDRGRAAPVVLVVTGWYPAVDARTAGRFVADQVRALTATSKVRPVVVAFDPLPVWGSAGLRTAERAAVAAAARTWGEGARGLLHPAAGDTGAPGPIARLRVAGRDSATPFARIVEERAMCLALAAPAIAEAVGRIALVHAHRGLPDGVAASRLARHLGVPFVLTEHASTLPAVAADPAQRALYAEATASAGAVVTVSRSLARDVLTIDPRVEPRLRVIPNVVHVDEFTLAPAGARRPGELLFVGFRKTSKGIDALLDAFAAAAAARPDLRLRLIGPPGPAEDERRWRTRAAAIGAPVSFEGEMDRAGIAAAMAQADVFVHPSPRETFGVVAAEALAAGLPVVTFDSGGVTEVLGDQPERLGRVVPVGDTAAFAAAILEVLADRGAFSADAARSSAVRRFGSDAVARGLLLAYADAGLDLGSPKDDERGVDGEPSAGLGSSPTESMVVVALDRARAALIVAALDISERARLVLVTADGRDVALPPGIGRTVVVPGSAGRHRALRAVGGTPGSTAADRRRRLVSRPAVVLRELLWRTPWRERLLLAATTSAIREAASGRSGARPLVVALDAFDALAAAPLVAAGDLAPAPGAGHWLGDGASAAGSAATGPGLSEGHAGCAAP
jgi:glycosyltransferase involved in cell wall biosynthesis